MRAAVGIERFACLTEGGQVEVPDYLPPLTGHHRAVAWVRTADGWRALMRRPVSRRRIAP